MSAKSTENIILGHKDSFRRKNLLGNIQMASAINWASTSLYLSFFDSEDSERFNYKILDVSKEVMNKAVVTAGKKGNIDLTLVF